jgi:hypothetical protein
MSRIASPNVYVTLSLSNVQFLLILFSFRILISHREMLQEDMYGRQSPSQSGQMLLQATHALLTTLSRSNFAA